MSTESLTREELRQLEIALEMGHLSGSDVAQWFGEGFSTFSRKGTRERQSSALGKLTREELRLINAKYWRDWRAENPERAKSYVTAYMARDPEKKRAMRQARKRRYQQRHRARYNQQQREAYARRVERKRAAAESLSGNTRRGQPLTSPASSTTRLPASNPARGGEFRSGDAMEVA